MSNWVECTLGDIIVLNYGKSLPERSRKVGNIPVYSSAGITGWHDTPLVGSRGLIVGRKGTIGTVYKSLVPFYAIDTTYYILPDDQIYDFNYLYYLLKSLGLDTLNEDSAVPGLNRNTAYLQSIAFPPMREQEAIAGILSSLDDKIDLLHRQNQTLEALAQTLFRHWFIDNADDGWQEGSIGDLINIQPGFAFRSHTFVECGKYRLVTIKNVQDAALDLTRTDYLNAIPDKMPTYCHLVPGDILLSLTGNVGRCCMVSEEDLLLNQRVAKLHPPKKRDWAYTYLLFRQPAMKQLLISMARGTAQLNLSPIETGKIDLLIPDPHTLTTFSDSVTPLLDKILKSMIQIRTLENLRDTLLPKLMSGEVRVLLSAPEQT